MNVESATKSLEEEFQTHEICQFGSDLSVIDDSYNVLDIWKFW